MEGWEVRVLGGARIMDIIENTMKTEGKGEYDMKTNEGWRLGRKGHDRRKTSTKMAETTSAGPTVMRQVNG